MGSRPGHPGVIPKGQDAMLSYDRLEIYRDYTERARMAEAQTDELVAQAQRPSATEVQEQLPLARVRQPALFRLLRRSAPVIATVLMTTTVAAVPSVRAALDASPKLSPTGTLLATARDGAVLLAVDKDAGTSTVVGTTGLPPQSVALAISPDGTEAYTIASTQKPADAHLAKIDLSTGAGTVVGHERIGEDLFIMGMTFSPDGILYAAGDFNPASPNFNSLYTVDLTTGVPTRVGSFDTGSTKSDYIMSFTWDAEGNMYGASMMSLVVIDRATGSAAKLIDFSGASTDPPKIMGIAFDENGTLYAADYVDLPQGGSTIYTVDLQTGVLTPVVKTGVALVHNIAFVHPSEEARTTDR